MSEVSWIKLKVGMFDDEKISLIESLPEADAILLIWIRLLLQAGKTNAGGYIFLTEKIPFSDEMLASIFRRPLNIVRLALNTFQKLEMIEIDEKGIVVLNWEKHQNVEGLEKIREQNRNRVAKFRQNQRAVTLHVTQRNAIDKEEDKEKEIDIKEPVSIALEDQVINIWIRSFGRNPKEPEREETERQLKSFGFDKTFKLYKDAVKSNVKSIKTLLEHTDKEGGFIPFQNNYNNKTVGKEIPAAHQYL